jgi:hypothetical protein
MTATCKVTLTVRPTRAAYPPCGLPVAANGLCAKHEADRIRLGGTK